MHPDEELLDGYLTARLPNRLVRSLLKDAKTNKVTKSKMLYLILCGKYGYPAQNQKPIQGIKAEDC